MGLRDQVAIVTGAGQGIGAEIARVLASEGCRVVVWDINESAAAGTVEELKRQGGEAFGVVGDIGDPDSVAHNVEVAVRQFGPPNILVNNAATVRYAKIQDMSSQAWDVVIQVTLTGAFNCTRAVAPLFIAANHGRIINIASRVHLGDINNAGYVSAKAGLIGLTRATALELAPYATTVNAIAPGLISTEGQRALPGSDEIRRLAKERTPIQRDGMPIDVARMVAFLASPASGFITGEVIHVTGGRYRG